MFGQGSYSPAEAVQILADEFNTQRAAGHSQGEAFARCVIKFNLRSFDRAVSALFHAGCDVDELKESDWPEGYPVSEIEHTRRQRSLDLDAAASLPRPQTAAAS